MNDVRAQRSTTDRIPTVLLTLAPIFVVVALVFVSVGTPPGADDATQVSDPQWLYWTLFASLGGLSGALGFALLARRAVPGDAGVAAMLTAATTAPLWLLIFITAGYAAGAMSAPDTTVALSGERLALAVDIFEGINNAVFLVSGALLGAVAIVIGTASLPRSGVLGRGVAGTGVAMGVLAVAVNGFLALTKNASEQGWPIGPMASLLLLIWGAWAGWQHLGRARRS